MTHPRLSVSALCSIKWSFDQDLALWRQLGVHHAGLMGNKLADDRDSKIAQLQAAGIRSATVVSGSLPLADAQSWDAARAALNESLDLAAATGGISAYCPPGRSTGKPWREVLDAYAQVVAPSVAYAKARGLRLSMEPSLRADASFVNTLRDAIDVAERTGVGLIIDFGNCWMERDLREVLERATPHIALVQICDVIIGSAIKPSPGGRVHIGDGELPMHRLMDEVLNTGYQGLFDLEVLGPSIEAEGYELALRRGVDRASSLLAEMGI
jgi:sugar phosphate isomerase/epimerase